MLPMLSDSVDINTDQERENILCQTNTRTYTKRCRYFEQI